MSSEAFMIFDWIHAPVRIMYTVTTKNVAPESVPDEIELLRSIQLTFESETTSWYHFASHVKEDTNSNAYPEQELRALSFIFWP